MAISLDRWKGKVAIVTGASVGIGAAIVEALVDAGIIVVGLARRKEIIEANAKKFSKKPGKLHALQTDIGKEEDILDAFKWVRENLGIVHILVNNAGIGANASLINGDSSKWRKVFDINVLGLCIATREAVRDMRANNVNGQIIHINSVAGHAVPPVPFLNVYPASKFAVTALTETLRQELISCGSTIKVTSISPGPVDTAIAKEARLISNEIDDIYRLGLKPEDIADSVMYVLATPPHVEIHELTLRAIRGDKQKVIF